MALPAQLKKQVEATEAFYNKDADIVDEADKEEAGSQDQAEDRTVSDIVPSTDDDTSAPDDTTQADVGVAKSLSDESDSEQKQEPDAKNDELKAMQQRYSSLQGMYNSNISQLREATAQIEQLRQAVTTLQAPQAAPEQKPERVTPPVSAEELEEYSPAFFEMLDRYVGSKIDPLKTSLESVQQLPGAVGQIDQTLRNVAAEQAKTYEDKFFEGLTQLHPDWQQINNSPEYFEWLQVTDPLSGFTRKALLDEARNRLDLNLVSNSFAEFKATTGNTGKAVQNKSHKDELRQQAVVNPRRGQSGIPADSGAKKSFTKADLDKLYSDQLHGKYRGPEKEAEFKKREAELMQAIVEGRYTS